MEKILIQLVVAATPVTTIIKNHLGRGSGKCVLWLVERNERRLIRGCSWRLDETRFEEEKAVGATGLGWRKARNLIKKRLESLSSSLGVCGAV